MLESRDYVPANTNGSRAIVVVSWIFPVLATIAVSARFAARKLRKAGLGLDDWIILAALVLFKYGVLACLWIDTESGCRYLCGVIQPSS